MENDFGVEYVFDTKMSLGQETLLKYDPLLELVLNDF